MIGFGIDQIQAEYVAEIKLRNINKEYILKHTQQIGELERQIADLEATLKSEELTAADTLLLRQQGILPDTTVQKADSLLMPAAGEPLDGGSRETVVPDRKGKSSRRKQRKQSSEAVLPEERTATR